MFSWDLQPKFSKTIKELRLLRILPLQVNWDEEVLVEIHAIIFTSCSITSSTVLGQKYIHVM